jgi:hypothetical protein
MRSSWDLRAVNEELALLGPSRWNWQRVSGTSLYETPRDTKVAVLPVRKKAPQHMFIARHTFCFSMICRVLK